VVNSGAPEGFIATILKGILIKNKNKKGGGDWSKSRFIYEQLNCELLECSIIISKKKYSASQKQA
jgi:hypothetical protein